MNQLTETGHGTGAVIDRVDLRDYKYSEVGFGTPPFDWSLGYDIEAKIGILPVKNQGQSGSCGGQAWANLAGALEALGTGSIEERSAKYVYAQTYAPGGGSYGRDNANIYAKQGVSREIILTSYDNGNPPTEAFMERGQDVTSESRIDAKLDMGPSYSSPDLTIDEVARALRDTGGVVIGIDGQDNGTWLSAFPLPPQTVVWRHFLYVGKAKLIDGKKYIGVLNSWGASVGENGWQWLPEDFFTLGHIWGAWTHVFNKTPTPPSLHYHFMLDLLFGASGGDIPALQTALQIDGEFPKNVPITGYFGDITRRAVLAFQLKYKVAPTAELMTLQGKRVGPATRAQLNQIFNQ